MMIEVDVVRRRPGVSSITSRPIEYSGMAAINCSQFSNRVGGTRSSIYPQALSIPSFQHPNREIEPAK
jgi:hypothetical protein